MVLKVIQILILRNILMEISKSNTFQQKLYAQVQTLSASNYPCLHSLLRKCSQSQLIALFQTNKQRQENQAKGDEKLRNLDKLAKFETRLTVFVNKTNKQIFTNFIDESKQCQIYKKCKEISGTFQIVNFTIKNVMDNIFYTKNEGNLYDWSSESRIKEKAIFQILKNQHQRLKESFQIWRKQSFRCTYYVPNTNAQKTYLIKSLQSIHTKIVTSKKEQAIEKFKKNKQMCIQEGKNTKKQ